MKNDDKEFFDKLLEKLRNQKWQPESCIQEFYSEVNFNGHYNFYHNGHEYLITFDEIENEDVCVIYDRDLFDSKVAYNTEWESEPKEIFKDISELTFYYRLKNDGRSLSDYICDYNKVERNILAEPVDKNLVGKIWKR